MKQILLRVAFAVAFMVSFLFSGHAQSAIEKVVKQLESVKEADITYSERRDPSTKKIIKSSRIITFKSDYYAQRLEEAFEKERENAISSTRGKNYYLYKFTDGTRYYFTLDKTGRGKNKGSYELIVRYGEDSFTGSLNIGGNSYSLGPGNVTTSTGEVISFEDAMARLGVSGVTSVE